MTQLTEPLPTDGNISVPTMKLKRTVRNKILNYQVISVMNDDEVSFITNASPCHC